MVAVGVHLSQTINNLAKILRPRYIYAYYMHGPSAETPNQNAMHNFIEQMPNREQLRAKRTEKNKNTPRVQRTK